jgi:D-arabinose 1-dehydrogenase-like Zn-dependent alcohol dehydrogenase
MKAAVVPAIGGTWRLEDVPAPKPEPNQVLIRIRASGFHQAGGADVLLHTSNSYEGLPDMIEALRPDGRLVLMGASTDPLVLPPLRLILKRLRVLGSQQNGPDYLYEALDLVAKGKVKVMAETYPLDEIGEACKRVATGKVRFRAVITRSHRYLEMEVQGLKQRCEAF